MMGKNISWPRNNRKAKKKLQKESFETATKRKLGNKYFDIKETTGRKKKIRIQQKQQQQRLKQHCNIYLYTKNHLHSSWTFQFFLFRRFSVSVCCVSAQNPSTQFLMPSCRSKFPFCLRSLSSLHGMRKNVLSTFVFMPEKIIFSYTRTSQRSTFRNFKRKPGGRRNLWQSFFKVVIVYVLNRTFVPLLITFLTTIHPGMFACSGA